MQGSFLRRIGKPLVILYVVFLILGWVCIYEASYVKTQTSIFDIHYRSGMQLLWIGVSVITALVILNTKPLVFYSWSYIIYIGVIILLVVTLFVAPNIKGSHSWLVIGSFSLQPAEFAKFSTALVLAYFYSLQSFSNISLSRKIFITVFVIALPMIIILLQKETGSALVFLALSRRLIVVCDTYNVPCHHSFYRNDKIFGQYRNFLHRTFRQFSINKYNTDSQCFYLRQILPIQLEIEDITHIGYNSGSLRRIVFA